jgi:hypothetical protein
MTIIDVIGWLAAGLTLLTFSMRRMVGLRSIAIASNVAFILFGYLGGIMPVLVLHLCLFPCNIMRLFQIRAAFARQIEDLDGTAPEPARSNSQDGTSPEPSQGCSVIFTGAPRLGEVRVLIPLNVAR